MFCKYVLQRQQGQESGFHFLMEVLKLSTYYLFFISRRRYFHIFGPKTLMISMA